jgi:hypothetical protein
LPPSARIATFNESFLGFLRPEILDRLKTEQGFTRLHALAEAFSCLTGNPIRRISADHAAGVIQ